MEGKSLFLLGTLLAIIVVSGCIGEEVPPTPLQCTPPTTNINNMCCLDDNGNGVCDELEDSCPSSCDDNDPCTNDACSGATNFRCSHSKVYPCCGNDVCDQSEEVTNTCPEDCEVVNITDFHYEGLPDYMEGDKFVFIHTGAVTYEYRIFYLNITTALEQHKNIRYTFKCNSTQNPDIDSINAEANNVSDQALQFGMWNYFEDDAYKIYSYFLVEEKPHYRLDVDLLDYNQLANFRVKLQKKEPQKRDDIICLFNFYFTEPRKMVEKWLEVSFI